MRNSGMWKSTAAVTAAAVLLCTAPVSVYAEESQVVAAGQNMATDIRIGDAQIVKDGTVTGESYPGVTYNADTNTLIFDNADIKGTVENSEGIVYVEGNTEGYNEITIELIGENTIAFEEALTDDNPWALVELIHYSKATFEGSGTLNLTGQENVRNGIILTGRINGDISRSEFVIDGCTVNIDSGDMDADDWFMGIHGSWGMDLKLKAAELNINAENDDQSLFQAILGDAAREAGRDVTIKAEDSRLYIGGSGQRKYGLDTLAGAEFINSDVRLEFPGGESFPAFAAEGTNCTIAIDSSTTFTWVQTDNTSYYLDNMTFDIKGSPYIYTGEYAGGPWSLADSTDEAFGRDGEGRMNVWKNFMISPEKLEEEIRGDINGDGYVNLGDATLCLKHIADQGSLTGERLTAADMNGDGVINVGDLTLLLNIINNN